MMRRLRSLPGPVWTMLLWAVGSVANAIVLAVWFSDRLSYGEGWIHQVLLEAVVIVVLLVLAARTPAWLLHVFLVLQMWSIAMLCVALGDPVSVATWWVGAMGAVLYAGYWWHGIATYAYLSAFSLGFLVVMWLTDTAQDLTMTWILYTTMAAALALGLNALVGRLEDQARYDPLTGMLNRNGLNTYLEIHATAGRTGLPRSLVAIDLDGFKAVNDTLGHVAGDRMLQSMTSAWRGELRPDDLAVRMGGDEFLLILPQTDTAGAVTLVHRLRAADPTRWSYGAVDWPSAESFDAALARADRLLYEDKATRTGDGV